MANTAVRLAGVTTLQIDSVSYNVTDASVTLGKWKREVIGSLNAAFAGTKDTLAPGQIKVTILDSSGFDAGYFNTLTNATVAIGQANGKTITGINMVCTEQVEINPAEGKGELTFMGPPLRTTGVSA